MRFLVLSALVAVGCARGDVAGSSQSLTIGAPSSLKEPFEKAAAAFRAQHPEIGANLLYGAPAQLAESGVTLDLVAADSGDGLLPFAGRLIDAERRGFAANPLVLVVKKGAREAKLKTLADNAQVRTLAVSDSRGDAAGQAAEAALGRLGLRVALNNKLRYLGNGDMVLEQVARGEADAGLVLAVDEAVYAANHGGIEVADTVDDGRTKLPIAPLKGTPRLQAARAFMDELAHGEAQKILSEKHYLLIDSKN